MKKFRWFLLLWTALAFSMQAAPGGAQAQPDRDLFSDTWYAMDAQSRILPDSTQTRIHHHDRFVGIFYFLWHGGHGTPGPYDISKSLAANPAAPAYGPEGAFHWWGEPETGYFLADDPWILRRNLSLLQDAGVDVLLLDVTNAFTYPKELTALCDMAAKMRSEGNQTPQIAFVTHAHSAETVKKLWDDVYSKKRYPDLWFQWRGKPLILGYENDRLPGGQPLDADIRRFFTWRESWAWEPGTHRWPWIERFPQRGGYDVDPDRPEEAPVSVASHPTLNIGRSFHDEKEPPLNKFKLTEEVAQGLNFAEQWRRLLALDPEFCFITGWNEWVAQRFTMRPNQGVQMMGRPLKSLDTFFVDAYNEEFSRDIEPMRGGYGDAYYWQMVDGIRRFKGVRPRQQAVGYKTLPVSGQFSQWKSVTPEYRDTIGDTAHRDWKGWGTLHYKNETGRNDIVAMKAACDAKNIYFWVQTRAPLTKYTDKNWMRLLIGSEKSVGPGWESYNFIVNNPVINAKTTTLTRLSDGKVYKISYRVAGNQMQIAIPRKLLLQNNPNRVSFQFHWLDNIAYGSDLSDWRLNGDSAPNGRANYVYVNNGGDQGLGIRD